MRTFVAIIILLLILLGIGFIANFGERNSDFFGNKDKEKIEEETSFLILGRVAEGQGGQWHLAPNLTDAIVIAQYVPGRNVVNLVSLPRDLYGEFGGTTFKINEVYHRKKIEEFMQKLPEVIGIEVNKYVVVDVDVIKAAIDNLGGIDVELEDPVTDPVTRFRLEPGMHHLSGEDAIWVMRNRFSPEGDFFREKNQHSIIAAIFNTFSGLGPAEKTSFFLNMVPYVQNTETNFSVGEFVPKFGNVGELYFNSVTMDFSTGLLLSSYIPVGPSVVATTTDATTTEAATSSRAYVLVPKEGINNYNAIRAFVESKLQ